MTLAVLLLHTVSFAVMAGLLLEYRHLHKKRMALLRSLSHTPCAHYIWERRLLMGTYAGMTAVIATVTLVLAFYQPHLL